MGRFLTSGGIANAGFFGPKPSSALASGGWTARTITTAAAGFSTNVAATNGAAILLDSNGDVWRSTDGGTTWSAPGVNIPGAFAVIASAGTFLVVLSNSVFRSIDGGVTFSAAIPLHFTGLNGAVWGAGNGAGIWVVQSTASRNTSISTDDGLTWAQHAIIGAGGWVVSEIWDGAQWVAISSVNAIATSPNGIAWTFTPLSPGSEFYNNTLAFQSGQYTATIFNGTDQSVRNAATPALVSTASDIPTSLPGSSGPQCILAGNGIYWVFDNAGNVSGSMNGNTWSSVPLNFQAGDFPGTIFQAYDSVNHSFIAVGVAATSISTHNDTDIL